MSLPDPVDVRQRLTRLLAMIAEAQGLTLDDIRHLPPPPIDLASERRLRRPDPESLARGRDILAWVRSRKGP